MRHGLLALTLVSSIFPVLAFAAPAGAPCDLVDREALVALQLGESKMKAEHKLIPVEKDAPMQGIDLCTFTPRNAPLPSLSVTTAKLPADAKTVKPSCNWQLIPGVGMEIATCSATVRNIVATFVMATKGSSDSAMKTTFRLQVERLVNRLAAPGSQGTPSK